jgi:large subunit ribosomal protein L20
MCGLAKAKIELDRKVLSELAISEPEAFKALVEEAEAALAKSCSS